MSATLRFTTRHNLTFCNFQAEVISSDVNISPSPLNCYIRFPYFVETTFASKFEVMVHFVPALRECPFDSVLLLVMHVDTGHKLNA